MTSNIYSSSPSPYTNSPIRVPHSRQNTMTSSHLSGASSYLKHSTSAPSISQSSLSVYQDSIFETPRQLPDPVPMPTPPPRAHRAPTTSSISSFHSYDSKDPIIQLTQHEPSRFHNFAAKLLGSPSDQPPKNPKLLEAEQYAAALLSSKESYLKLELERKRDDEKRRQRQYASSFSTLPPRPPKSSKIPPWLPLGIVNSGLLSLFIALVLILSRDPVSIHTSEVVWLVLSILAMVGGGSWWIARKACPRARVARRERDRREMRGNLSRSCSYLDVENGSGGEQEMRVFRYDVMRSAGPVDRGRVYANANGGEEGLVAVRYGSLESLNRVGPVGGAGRMRSQTHPFESQFEGAADWRRELNDRPFVKSDNGSIFREEFEMGGWKGGRGEDPVIGVAM